MSKAEDERTQMPPPQAGDASPIHGLALILDSLPRLEALLEWEAEVDIAIGTFASLQIAISVARVVFRSFSGNAAQQYRHCPSCIHEIRGGEGPMARRP